MKKGPLPNQSEFRVPPQDLEAEQSVLGAMILSKEAIDVVFEIVEEIDFYREAHRKLFRSILNLHEKKEPADVITLTNELKRMGEFETIGGVSALTGLTERVPTAANAEYYAQIVKEKACARKLITAATQIVADAYADSLPINEMMDMAEFKIFEATERKETKGFKPISQLIGNVFEEVYETIGKEDHVTGIPFGIEQLDLLTRGLQPSKLYLIGARPGVGKTALAMNILWNVASGNNPKGNKYPVGIFSIEMNETEITQRLLCAVAGVNYMEAREGRMLERDRTNLTKASPKIYQSPIYVNDAASLTIMDLKAQARRLKRDHDVKLIVVDYLQIMKSGVYKDNREQEIAYISMNLKAMAKDLKIPVLVAAQLSRPLKGTEGRDPTLSDLRESGSLEQDSDVVIFIHKWKTKDDQWKQKLILAKQRSGPTEENIPIYFDAWKTTFSDVDNSKGVC